MKAIVKLVVMGSVGLFMVASPLAAQDAQTKKVVSMIKKEINASKTMSASVKKLAASTLMSLTFDKVVIKETEKQNSQKVSLATIQQIDKSWREAEEETKEMKDRLNNTTAQLLKKFVASNPDVVEVFVMDNQGAVVGENNLTSDYWQGDEAKWKNSFKGGKGGVDVGEVEFDKSANANLQQVSLPVVAKGGKIIGAITFGVKVN